MSLHRRLDCGKESGAEDRRHTAMRETTVNINGDEPAIAQSFTGAGHDARPMSVVGPSARYKRQSSPVAKDESGAAGELSGDVHDILTAWGPTRRNELPEGRASFTTDSQPVAQTSRHVGVKWVRPKEAISSAAQALKCPVYSW